MKQHPYKRVADGGRPRLAHIVIAEKAFGGPLPDGVEVHHANMTKRDNRNENLVICPDAAYHKLLHRRTKALDACGHADWLMCWACRKYDDPANLNVTYPKSGSIRCSHAACAAERTRAWRAAKQQAAA
jgi:hypothetical protein